MIRPPEGDLGSAATVHCPCCRGQFPRFLPFGVKKRPHARCPGCGALERHRLLWLYLENRTNLFTENLRLLHVAPEPIFHTNLGARRNIEYVSADLSSPLAMVRADVADLPFKENAFDAILCIHVLEHVRDDRQTLREFFRVLKPHGWAIIQSPIERQRAQTFEDFSITAPEDRERCFGKSDHVRVYGRDYRDRLERAGFAVTVEPYLTSLGADSIQKHGLKRHEDVYVCTKLSSPPGNPGLRATPARG